MKISVQLIYVAWLIVVILSCEGKKEKFEFRYPPTIIYPPDCSEEDSIKYVEDSIKEMRDDSAKQKIVEVKKSEGIGAKSTLDSLAKVVDKYIALRNNSLDSITWYRWEDSVKKHVAEGQILMNQKVSRLQDEDNSKEFQEGFKVKPKK